MPSSQVTRQRIIDRSTCILGFTGTNYVESYVFDATTLSPDANGFYTIPPHSFVTPSVASDPTKVKLFQALGTNVNAVQTITVTGTPTGGSFTLTFNGQTTAAIPFGATAAQVKTALVALPNIGAAVQVTTGGGALPGTPVTVTFQGLLGNQPVSTMTAVNSLTGGTTPAISVATTTVGQTAEHIVGVVDVIDYDLFGNSVGDDEAIPVYGFNTVFDTTKLANWESYSALAIAALPTCQFRP